MMQPAQPNDKNIFAAVYSSLISPMHGRFSSCRWIRILLRMKGTGYLITYSTEQSPFWEANWFSASQKSSRIFWSWKVRYHICNCLLSVPILSHIDPVHVPTSHFWRSILILSSHLCLGLPSGLFHSGFPTKTLYTSLPPCVLHDLPVTLFSVSLPEQYWVMSTHY